MNSACSRFRRRLAEVLEERAALVELGWHEHLFGCEDCRALLADEEALEHLLASLPEPKLPPYLVERVLARLAMHRELSQHSIGDPLDDLLDDAPSEEAPAGLAGRVLAGLAVERRRSGSGSPRAAGLDDLLDLLPDPEVPGDLPESVLAGLAGFSGLPGERLPAARPRVRLRSYRRAFLASLVAAAAVVLVTLWFARRGAAPAGVESGGPRVEIARASRPEVGREAELASSGSTDSTESAPSAPVTSAAEPDPELLASLDLLENWEVLASEDLDLLLDGLDETEAVLLEAEFQNTETTTQSDQG